MLVVLLTLPLFAIISGQVGPPAVALYGQNLFTETGCRFTKANAGICTPRGVAVDLWGRLYVADSVWNRVIRFPAPSLAGGVPLADFRIGQPDWTERRGTVSDIGLDTPTSVAVDDTFGIYVADKGNHRVLYYRTFLVTATRVYGQPNADSNVPNNVAVAAAQQLNSPSAVGLDSTGNLWIADTGNDRVRRFEGIMTSSSFSLNVLCPEAFDFGPDFLLLVSPCQNKVDQLFMTNSQGTSWPVAAPTGVAYRQNKVFISSRTDGCVFIYPDLFTTTPVGILGQQSLTGPFDTVNLNQFRMGSALSVTVDSFGNVYAGDFGANRVLSWGNASVIPLTSASQDISGTAAVPAGTSVTLSGSVSVIGDAYVSGTLVLTPSASLAITGTVTISGSISFSQGANLSGAVISVVPGGQFVPIITQEPLPGDSSSTVVIGTFGTYSGRATVSAVIASFPNASCYVYSSPTTVYSSNTLSVTADFTRQCGLSSTQIAIIAGAAVGGGILIAAAIVIVTILLVRRHTRVMESDLMRKDVEFHYRMLPE